MVLLLFGAAMLIFSLLKKKPEAPKKTAIEKAAEINAAAQAAKAVTDVVASPFNIFNPINQAKQFLKLIGK